jgi:hypothetical protein
LDEVITSIRKEKIKEIKSTTKRNTPNSENWDEGEMIAELVGKNFHVTGWVGANIDFFQRTGQL